MVLVLKLYLQFFNTVTVGDAQVGTGLGPTLEFYALVSREMQNVDLELWRGEPVKRNELRDDGHTYVFSATGLFPAPLARNAKMSHVNKIKSKFRFLGKFMAKALMDSRMVSHLCLLFIRY